MPQCHWMAGAYDGARPMYRKMMAGLSAGRVSASSYNARHTAKNLAGVKCEYEPSNVIRSRWCFVGAETFAARLEYRKVSDLNIRYVT
jgi:hypothetical protein